MAVPVLETWTGNAPSSEASSIVLTKPSGVVANDLLMLLVGNDDETNNVQFTDDLTGWTRINFQGGATPDVQVASYYRIADGTEGTTVTVNAESSDKILGWYLRISGVDTTSPINVSAFQHSTAGDSSSHSIQGVTTTVDDCLAFYHLITDGGDCAPFGTPSGWTEISELQTGTSAEDTGGVFGTKTQVTAGATGDASVTVTVSDSAAWAQFAIAPGDPVLAAGGGSYAESGTAAGLEHGRRLDAAAGTFTESGTAASLEVGYRVDAAAGSHAVSGSVATLLRAYVLAAESGSYSESGAAAGLLHGRRVDAGGGSFAQSGAASALVYDRALEAVTGSYAESGSSAGLVVGRVLSGDPGTYVMAGSTAGLSRARTLPADAGAFVESGSAAGLLRDLRLDAVPGAFVATGAAAGLLRSRQLDAGSGALVLTGAAASLLQARQLAAASGSYAMVGGDVEFRVRGPRPVRPSGDPLLLVEGDAPRVTIDAPIPQMVVEVEAPRFVTGLPDA